MKYPFIDCIIQILGEHFYTESATEENSLQNVGWTYEEFKKVIQTINRSNYEELQRFTTIWFYYMTGCRVSEGFALTWGDIDFSNRLLNIHATLEKNKDGENGTLNSIQKPMQECELLSLMISH